jgi:hypothetical protein
VAGLSGDRVSLEARFFRPYWPTLGLTQPPVQRVPGSFPQGKTARAWRWPPTPIYCRGWRKSRSICLLSLSAFMACSRVNFIFVRVHNSAHESNWQVNLILFIPYISRNTNISDKCNTNWPQCGPKVQRVVTNRTLRISIQLSLDKGINYTRNSFILLYDSFSNESHMQWTKVITFTSYINLYNIRTDHLRTFIHNAVNERNRKENRYLKKV